MLRSFPLDRQRLAELGWRPLDDAQFLSGFSDADQLQPPFARKIDHAMGMIVIGPDYGGPVIGDDFRKETKLGSEIGCHVPVIIEMIAAEIGECSRCNARAFRPVLMQPVAGRFIGYVGDALALQTGHVGQEGHDVRRRQSRDHPLVRCGHA